MRMSDSNKEDQDLEVTIRCGKNINWKMWRKWRLYVLLKVIQTVFSKDAVCMAASPTGLGSWHKIQWVRKM